MSRHAFELCTLLVDDTYGELTSRIYEVLLCYGRMSLPTLIYHTNLSDRLVKHGLSVLVQRHLVLWYTSVEDHLTTYEANTAVAYSLLRSGKYIKIAEAQAGEFAGKVISNLLLLGHARIGDLVQAYQVGQSKFARDRLLAVTSESPSKLKSNSSIHADRDNREERSTLQSIDGTLCDLLRTELVSQVHISHFHSDADNRSEAEKVIPHLEEYKAKSKRERDAQHEIAVKRKLKEWKYYTDGADQWVEGSKAGMKRPQREPEIQRLEKRQRLVSHSSQELIGVTGRTRRPMLEEKGELDSNLILRVNHAKFAVLMRNEHLVGLAGRTISVITGEVYAQVLRALQPKVQDCWEDPENLKEPGTDPNVNFLPQVSTTELVGAVRDSSELASALGNPDYGGVDIAQLNHLRKRQKLESNSEAIMDDEAILDEAEASYSHEDDDISDPSSGLENINGEANVNPNALPSHGRDPHREIIRSHLLVLAMHPSSFLHHLPKTSTLPERWTIDYPTLMKNVTCQTLLETVKSRHGLPAARLTRILFDRGKTDEKVLCSISLLAQKTMRSYLLPLHKAGMIGLQEVPRDNSRNPQRTNFLWFFDPERCKAKVLEETYKTMARCLQRVRFEREKVKATIEKASRSDVIGRELEFLSMQELEALNEWKGMDERIWGEMFRLDDVIACLRDF